MSKSPGAAARVAAGWIVLVALGGAVRAQGLITEYYGYTGLDSLGISLAGGDLDGDGFADIVLGSRGLSGAGRVHVYSGYDLSLLYDFLGQSNGDAFGDAIAVVGDVDLDGLNDLAIGAPNSSLGGNGSGSVTVFAGGSGAVIRQWNGSPYSALGTSVAAAGDVNQDGWPDVIAGAPFYSKPAASQAGQAVVLSGKDGSVLYQFEGTTAYEEMGTAVSGGMDANLDGYPDVLFTSSGVPGFGHGPGYVRLHSGKTGALLRNTFGPFPPAGFGACAAFIGDADGDGYGDYAVGAPYDDIGFVDAGSVRLYSGKTGQVLLLVSGAADSERLGIALDRIGDVDGDGSDDVLLGMLGGTGMPGRARAISGSDGSTILEVLGAHSSFGRHVGGLGDIDLDGQLEFAVGDTGWKSGAGRARVYTQACAGPVSYCTAKTNSLGCVPLIDAVGSPSLSGPDDFHLTAANVLSQKPGLLIWSREIAASPFGGGTLCLAAPLKRTTPQIAGGNTIVSDCTGTYDFHFSHVYMASEAAIPGETIYVQYWSRDPWFTAPNNIGLTDAMRFTVCP
jgi:hypothetical protein